MNTQEQYLLNKVFKANPATELTLINIIHKIMRVKNVSEPSQVDVLGITNAVKSLTEKGLIFNAQKSVHNFYGDKETQPVWYWVG